MKVLSILTLMTATVCGSLVNMAMHSKVHDTPEQSVGLTQLLTSTLSKMGPKEMTEPAVSDVGTEFPGGFPF